MRRIGLIVLIALAVPVNAHASPAQERELAERYAPVVRVVHLKGDCAPGDPYLPIDVGALFDAPTVALRGPWNRTDLVKIAPSESDLARGLYDYHLDFPGSALDPGCSYLDWQYTLTAGQEPTAYAHVVGDPGHPGRLALQYWFFYVFNDWNNLHEGDWEMVQLMFDAATPGEALTTSPVEIGYSQHEGAERAGWTDDKLELVDGTHPVVHPAAGSHANFFGESLYLGSSAKEGVGCDDTRGPAFDVEPVIKTIPSDPTLAREQYPWISFTGRWGELRPAFFNGPTGPNLKTQWTQPVTWSEDWRSRSYTVPASTAFGASATGFFCGVIGTGSSALVRLVDHPVGFGLALAALALLVIILIARATWLPSAPLRIARRRTWGQTLSSSARMYGGHFRLMVGMGILFIPISLLVALVQALVLHGASALGVQTGSERSGIVAQLVLVIGTTLTLLGLGLVQAACARALVEIDSGRRIGPVGAYRLALDAVRPLFGALLIAVVVVSLLTSSFFLIPIAVWLAGRWALIAPVIELEHTSALGALSRSGRLVRGHWFKVATLIVAGAGLVLVAGPLVGVILIFTTDAPFWLVNVVAGVLYAIAMPFVALTTTYVYLDARTRTELEGEPDPGVLPAEIPLAT